MRTWQLVVVCIFDFICPLSFPWSWILFSFIPLLLHRTCGARCGSSSPRWTTTTNATRPLPASSVKRRPPTCSILESTPLLLAFRWPFEPTNWPSNGTPVLKHCWKNQFVTGFINKPLFFFYKNEFKIRCVARILKVIFIRNCNFHLDYLSKHKVYELLKFLLTNLLDVCL